MMAQPSRRFASEHQMFDRERLDRLGTPKARSQVLLVRTSGMWIAGPQPKRPQLVRDDLRQSIARWFEHALAQVEQINQEALEEGCPRVNDVAKRNAKHVLTKARRCSIEPDVYPSMDGEIALYFKAPSATAGLLILLDNEGGAGCFWSERGKSEQQHHEDAWDLPAEFLLTRLGSLGGSSLSQSID